MTELEKLARRFIAHDMLHATHIIGSPEWAEYVFTAGFKTALELAVKEVLMMCPDGISAHELKQRLMWVGETRL